MLRTDGRRIWLQAPNAKRGKARDISVRLDQQAGGVGAHHQKAGLKLDIRLANSGPDSTGGSG